MNGIKKNKYILTGIITLVLLLSGGMAMFFLNSAKTYRTKAAALRTPNPNCSFEITVIDEATVTPTLTPTQSPPTVCDPAKPACKPGYKCQCSARGPDTAGGCFCVKD